jgi:hypothetical protein
MSNSKALRIGSGENFKTSLRDNMADFLVRRNDDLQEFIVDGEHYLYVNFNEKKFKHTYLYSMVKRDMMEFYAERGAEILLPKLPSHLTNHKYDPKDDEMIGTDLNHAYWRIAYLMGKISEKTYKKGLESTDSNIKVARLSALSVLGRVKTYERFIHGKFVENVAIQKDKDLKNYYYNIRYYCYQCMWELSRMLGDDFHSYRVDCVYYRRTEENINMVETYLNERSLLFEHLVQITQ